RRLRAMLGEAHRCYSRAVNFREGWRGYLFQGRFASYPMDDAHLIAAINRALARMFDELSTEQSLSELRARLDRLTPRELEVMDLVVEGCTSQAIAARLNISQRTVESYRVQIMEKMQAPSVAVLVRQAVRLARITP
ncbi:MAG TPA: LuxR C-terminal-related transcriptional regulator, partial [Hyphomicrobiaceae bacterium]